MMDKIEEQISELKESERRIKNGEYVSFLKMAERLGQAADTIESLSAKLQATNMESDLIKRESVLKLIEDIKCNPDLPKNYGTLLDIMKEVRGIPAVYDSENIIKVNMERSAEDCGGWIPCKERLPEDFNTVLAFTEEKQFVTVARDGMDWVLYDGLIIREKVIAWQQLPDPYHKP